MAKCPKCGEELITKEGSFRLFCSNSKCSNYNKAVLYEEEKSPKDRIKELWENGKPKKMADQVWKEQKKTEEEMMKKLEQERIEKLKKAALAAGGTAVVAGGAYAANKYINQPPPSYKKGSPILKYLLTLIIGGIVVFGLYKYGPNIWENIKSNIPEDSDFFMYLNCLWELFTTGNAKAFNECTEKSPSTDKDSRVVKVSLGYGDNELYTPYAGQEYYVPVKVENLDIKNSLTVEVWGSLNYKDQSVELIPDPNKKYPSQFKIFSLPLNVMLKSREELTCDVKKYDNLTINVEYFDHSASKIVSYLIAEKEEELKSAKISKPESSVSPIDIIVDFYPEKYYPDMGENNLGLTLTFKNKLGNSEAKITGIEIKRPGDTQSQFLSLEKCEWNGQTFSSENTKVPINVILTSKAESLCYCIYNIGDVSKFLDKDPYKPMSFVITVYYDFTIKLVNTDSKILKVQGCSDTTSGTPNTIPTGNFCNYDQKQVEDRLREVGGSLGIDCPADILYGIAKVESSLAHCKDGKVKTGDNGKSIGLMQVKPGGCPDKNIYNVYENIECGVKVLKDKYSQFSGKPNNYDPEGCGYYCTTPCERAVRGYNGWNCRDENNQIITGKLKYVCNVYKNLNPPQYPSCPN